MYIYKTHTPVDRYVRGQQRTEEYRHIYTSESDSYRGRECVLLLRCGDLRPQIREKKKKEALTEIERVRKREREEWWCAYRGVERARLVSDAFGPANDDDHVAEVSLPGNYLPAASCR